MDQTAVVAISTAGAVLAASGAQYVGHRLSVRRDRYAEVSALIDAAVQAFTEALARVDRLHAVTGTRHSAERIQEASDAVSEWENRARAAIYSLELRTPMHAAQNDAFYEALAALTASWQTLGPWVALGARPNVELPPIPEFDGARQAAHEAFQAAMDMAAFTVRPGELPPPPGRLKLRWMVWRTNRRRDREMRAEQRGEA